MSMAKLSPSRRHCLKVSVAGAILIVPWGIFMGMMLPFSGSSDESRWFWTFDSVTFWCQVLAVLLSFALPRIGAIWMLVNIAISALIAIGFLVHSAYQPDARHMNVMEWLQTLPELLHIAGMFWMLPFIAAILLLYASRNRRDSSQSAANN
jgi:hypothetical protein